ncbi:hypothetical protein [Paracidovorax anthurii]|uniref:Uncharacterized protein n=1 Tax=Paracidovorax anthurii TaxID=78229 RepID=A0A328Y9I5_9BURK|nr:hypothetical protein [Paracidovorax anthurii]RAR70260.1 hypothetical protein AX018_11154 [Paracidovorax anthurii]
MKPASPLNPPLVIAIAKDKYLTPKHPFPDSLHIPAMSPPLYGQDITYGCRSSAPRGHNVGNTAQELRPKMLKLLDIFAKGERTGMAKRLFTEFLCEDRRDVSYFDDNHLNTAVNSHSNINYFCSAILSAPNSPHKSSDHHRIHQSLMDAGWDIKKVRMPVNIGVPALNIGSTLFSTRDYHNGLGLMINGIQYVYVIATHYAYDSEKKEYALTLKFVFYDVFGLDDDDLNEYGSLSDGFLSSPAGVGITAWWQLQHQLAYPPLVTRVVLNRTYEAPAL